MFFRTASVSLAHAYERARPFDFAQGTISHTLASVGLSGQLDRATPVALAHDMMDAARRS